MATKKNSKLFQSKFDLEELIEKREFCAQTPNGTALPFGTGWNRDYRAAEPSLVSGYDYQAPPGGPWQSGRSNRTGE